MPRPLHYPRPHRLRRLQGRLCMLIVLGLVLAPVLPGPSVAFADFLEGVSDFPETAYYREPESFLAPNETSPAEGVSLLSAAPVGVHVAVGTERGFIGAALNGNATHLLLLDRDRDAVRFNQINTELLRVAKNRLDYLGLRFASDRKAWVQAWALASEGSGSGGVERLSRTTGPPTKDDFSFWRRSLSQPGFDSFHVAASRPYHPFWRGNYLHDDALYNRVAALARAGRIRSIQVNFADTPRMKRILEALHEEHLKVGVLDISNAWWPKYLGREGFVRMLQGLAPAMGERSLLMMSEKVLDPESRWIYFAAQPGGSRDGESLGAFYDELQKFHLSGEWPGPGARDGIRLLSPPARSPLECLSSFLIK